MVYTRRGFFALSTLHQAADPPSSKSKHLTLVGYGVSQSYDCLVGVPIVRIIIFRGTFGCPPLYGEDSDLKTSPGTHARIRAIPLGTLISKERATYLSYHNGLVSWATWQVDAQLDLQREC